MTVFLRLYTMVSPMFKGRGRQFFLGLCVGLSVSLMLQTYRHFSIRHAIDTAPSIHLSMSRATGEIVHGTLNAQQDGDQKIHRWMDDHVGNAKHHTFEDNHLHHDDASVAEDLKKRVRVLCWILTSPSNLDRKAIHVKKTWAARCNIFLFMSSVKNDSFPTVGLNVSEGREHLTAKTMQAFQYIYHHYYNDAEWFMKADDDTYVIVENLRYFLSGEDPMEPVYFGQRFKPIVKQGYTSGGSGYVLSKEALRRYALLGSKDPRLCAKDNGAEDVQMGRCLQNIGVVLKPSTDALGRSRFHCFSPETMIKGRFPDWYRKYDLEGAHGGLDNISDYAISFHYVPPEKMYFLEFYTYHLQPYGIINKPQQLNRV